MLNVKKIRPMANYLVTTREMYEEDKVINGVLTPTRGTLKEYQKVVAVGPVVRGINVGDVVSVRRPRRLRSCEGENEGEQHHGCP